MVRSLATLLVVAAFNITVALVVLIAWRAEPWSLLLFAGIGAVLVVVYRSYSQFVVQHRTLTELYDLTRSMGDAGRDGTLPDVLLAGVRELLQAESATLWLPSQGRYPELHAQRPGRRARPDRREQHAGCAARPRGRQRARRSRSGRSSAIPGMRALIRDSGVKDAIVVPLRSGSVVIGSLEVTGRLGDVSAFRPADVRLLETLAAHAAVAVENSRLVDRLRFDAYHDPLTGLPNRRRVLALLEEAVKVQAPGEVVAVLAFDIDGLRDVNDSIGHDAGDSMVIEVAARLRALAPAAALVGRGGSDEFLVTVRLPSADDALRLATKLRVSLQEPMEVESVTLDVDVVGRRGGLPRSRHRRRARAQAGRPGRADGQAAGQPGAAVPLRPAGPLDPPAGPGRPAAARAGERRDRGLLPAEGRAAGPPGGRRRVPGPLGPPDARHRSRRWSSSRWPSTPASSAG